MKNIFGLVLSLLIVSTVVAEEKPVIKLWPNGLPKGSRQYDAKQTAAMKKKTTSERIAFVDDPTITVYRAAKDKANGTAVVICPGGGYNILAWPKEGLEIAEWFNSIGVTAAVLQYRVPRRDPAAPHTEPLQDSQRAIRVVRSHAKQWGVDVKRVGILGFSAGGHLTVMTALHSDQKAYDRVDDADDLSCRPDFAMPIYCAYLGEKGNDTKLNKLVKVTKDAPPMFMAVTWDDKNRGLHAALLAGELKKAGVPAECHIYSKGGHGYGIRPSDKPVVTWNKRAEEWMRVSGLLEKAKK